MKNAGFVTEKTVSTMKVCSEGQFFLASGSEIDYNLARDIYSELTLDLQDRTGHSDMSARAENFAFRKGFLPG